MRFSLALDHLAVVARTLDEGTNYVEAVLGAELSPGGKHPQMSTHNRLLSLGHDIYLEVIAVDPDAPQPKHTRWFDLDGYDGAPRLTHWICNTDDIDAALDAAPSGSGESVELTRGDMTWQMSVPKTGTLPYDNAMPAIIEWGDNAMRPARRLPDHGFRLTRLDVFHAQADRLLEDFPAINALHGQVALLNGPEKRLIASISTPEGDRILA